METLLNRGFGNIKDINARLQGRKQSQDFKTASDDKIAAWCSRREGKKFSYSNFSCLDPSHLQCKQEFYLYLVLTPDLRSLLQPVFWVISDGQQ